MTEINLDTASGKAYASRNHNDLRHVWQAKNTERNEVDWLLTLRQHYPRRMQSRHSASVPNFSETRQKPSNSTEPEEGAYQTRWKNRTELDPQQNNEQYANFAETGHMLKGAATKRVSSGGFSEINWQLNLRGGKSGKPDTQWKRYYQKPHQSFDMAPTNFANYDKQLISPAQRKIERTQSCLPMEMLRDEPLEQVRWPGCEGSATNQWEHLVSDRKHGHKSRNNLKWETTLREKKGYLENLGSRISDNRSEGCVVEMLGKKNWHYGTCKDVQNDLAKPYREGGDPKLHVIRPVLGEPHEESLKLRRHKQQRLQTQAGTAE